MAPSICSGLWAEITLLGGAIAVKLLAERVRWVVGSRCFDKSLKQERVKNEMW